MPNQNRPSNTHLRELNLSFLQILETEVPLFLLCYVFAVYFSLFALIQTKFHHELGIVDFSNYKKAYQKRAAELEKSLANIKNKFSSMDSSQQKEATKHIKSTKDRLNFLEKEFKTIEKKVK